MNTVYAANTATSAADAAKITPRAEFRVFGHGIIAEVQPRLWNGKTVLYQARTMPAETYFLSRHTHDVNVKVRDGLLDIKIKTGATPEGYEIFQPSGKFQFPVTNDQLASIASHLKVTLAEPIVLAASVPFDEFRAMAHRHPDLTPIVVNKTRWGFSIDGIICEYAQVYFNGAMLESACVESENYAGMRDVIERLGLASRPNTNYLRAAATVVGMD
jgi:hypothetical protein